MPPSSNTKFTVFGWQPKRIHENDRVTVHPPWLPHPLPTVEDKWVITLTLWTCISRTNEGWPRWQTLLTNQGELRSLPSSFRLVVGRLWSAALATHLNEHLQCPGFQKARWPSAQEPVTRGSRGACLHPRGDSSSSALACWQPGLSKAIVTQQRDFRSAL